MSESSLRRHFDEIQFGDEDSSDDVIEKKGKVENDITYECMPLDEWIKGPDADEIENKENPILEDEKNTRNNFCYMCNVADDTHNMTFIKTDLLPRYKEISPEEVTRSIRGLYNKQIRPYLPPNIKQRWTLKQIWAHVTKHDPNRILVETEFYRHHYAFLEEIQAQAVRVVNGKKEINISIANLYIKICNSKLYCFTR
jgi:hypothetical protein